MTYYHSQETNGVHWLGSSHAVGNFDWIAPELGTGEVRLYYAGLQGSLSNGASHDTVLVSQELTMGVEDTRQIPQLFELQQNYPNPFNGETIIGARIFKPGEYRLIISNILGQIIFNETRNVDSPGFLRFTWSLNDKSGQPVPSGIYFYTLEGSDFIQSRKMLLLR
jgi:hypothetical protein